MKRTYGKLIALLLVLVMAVGMIPAAFAAAPSQTELNKIEKNTVETYTFTDTVTKLAPSKSGVIQATIDTKDKTKITIKGLKEDYVDLTVTFQKADKTTYTEVYSFHVISSDLVVKMDVTKACATTQYSNTDAKTTIEYVKSGDLPKEIQVAAIAYSWGEMDAAKISSGYDVSVTYSSSNDSVIYISPKTGLGEIRSIPSRQTFITLSATVSVLEKGKTTKLVEKTCSTIVEIRNDKIALKDIQKNNEYDKDIGTKKVTLKEVNDKDDLLIAQISDMTFKGVYKDASGKEVEVMLPLLQNTSSETHITVDKSAKPVYVFTADLNLYDASKNIEYTTTESPVTISGEIPETVFKSHPEDKTVELGQAMGTLSAMIDIKAGTIDSIKWYGVENDNQNKELEEVDAAELSGKTSFLTTLDLSKYITQPGKYPFFCVVEYNGKTERSKIAVVTVTGQYKIELTMPQTTVTVGQNLNLTATIKTYDANATTADKYVAYNGKENITWTVSETKLLSIKNSITTSGASQTLTAKATENGNDKVVRVTVRATIDGKDLTEEKDITIKAAVADDIKLVVKDSADVAFTEVPDKLTTLVRAKTNNVSPNYIRIQTPDYGTLYTTTSKSARAEANRDYTLTELGRFCLNANMDHATNTIQYVAYNADGAIAKGKIVVSTTANRIEYYLNTGEYVTFNRMDFYQMFHDAYASDSMQYVTFDITADDKLDTTRNGYLRTNTSQASATVAANTQCFYAPASNAQALGTVTYYSGTSTAKYVITIPFKAFGRTATSGTNEMEGNVIIYVNYSKTIKTTSIGASFLSESVASKLLPDGVNASDAASYYVQFEKPSSGKMYENYRTYVGTTPLTESVFTSNRYYLASNGSEKTVSILYYLPKADVYKATLAYKVYKTDSSTPVDEGNLTFEIEKQTSSKYFSKDTNAKDSGAWASNAVDFAYANSLVNGVGTSAFGPEQNMTRAMLVTILYRAAGSPSVAAVTNPFKDLKKGAYYEDAVLWAYSRGVVNGSSPTTFNPDGRITRQDIAAILYRASGSPSTSGSLAGFGDANSVSGYAENAMRWAVQNGIITGTTVKNVYMLNPTGYATRAQVVVMLHRYLTQ